MTRVTPDELVELFHDVCGAVGTAVGAMTPEERQVPGGRPTQYALDLVADEAALLLLNRAPIAVVSEESGRGGDWAAPVTVVIDPVDGSTNCSRGIPYWSTSLAAIDAGGLLAAMVVNQASGTVYSAVRGAGARRDGERLEPPPQRPVEDAVVAAIWAHVLVDRTWGSNRTLGSAALELCDVAGGRLDGYVDPKGTLFPWDYLGGLLVCRETGVAVVDHQDRELVETGPDEQRQVVAANSPDLLGALRAAIP